MNGPEYECHNCDGSGEVGESPDGAVWYAGVCSICNGHGKTARFVRVPGCDKRIGRGDDFAGDAWLDQITRRIVYSAVWHSKAND